MLGANIGGIPELVRPGQTGELFESGNADDLRVKLETLWAGVGARPDAAALADEFSSRRYLEQLLPLYRVRP